MIIMVDPAIYDSARYDYGRYDVYLPIFDEAVEQFKAQGLSPDVTRYKVSLGEKDSVTGWLNPDYTAEPIEMPILQRGASLLTSGGGLFAKYNVTGFTCDAVKVGEYIKTLTALWYRVQLVEDVHICDSFAYRMCSLVLDPFIAFNADAPPTIADATWHTDSQALITDPRYRHKTYLDTYLTAGNLLKDDGVTQVEYTTCFNGYPYQTKDVLADEDIDVIFCIDKKVAKPRETQDHSIYAFDETVPITVYAIDKTGLTATNIIEQAEQEIRHIVTDYPLGSIRRIGSTDPTFQELGATKLWQTTVTIEYRRANDDYIPTAPTFSNVIGYTYEADRLSGGTEGTWTENDGGSTVTYTIDEYNNLDIEITAYVGDAYVETKTAGNNLGLSSTTHTRARFRYKTSGNATAKIVLEFNDASTQTLLAETASSTWVVGDVAITTAKTIDHIYLYCCDGTGHVYYDFLQIYANNYILPNVVRMDLPSVLNAPVLPIPGFSGSKSQKLGSEIQFTMTCDLDMEHSTVTWKRPQGDTATDSNNLDPLYELWHYMGCDNNYLWTWLSLGSPDMQFKAELVETRPSLSGEEGMVDLVWREYRHGNASDETYTERFGIGL